MTKQQAKELALRMQQRGYVVTPPSIEDDVLKAHLRWRSEEHKAPQTPEPKFSIDETSHFDKTN